MSMHFPKQLGTAQPLVDPELQFRGPHGERGDNGGLGAEPLVRGSGELKAFWPSDVQQTQQICTLGPLQYFQFKASYSNLNP